MTANLDNLLMQLFEKGVDTEITTDQGDIRVAVSLLKTKETVGVATGSTAEEAFATIFRNLVDNNTKYKENNANSLRSLYSAPFKGLSYL